MLRENLKYLTVEQTLNDFNDFMKEYRLSIPGKPRAAVLFGGSYGGMLAAWLRMKFPQTFQGAIAASAPIIYFKGASDPQEFYKIITDSYKDAQTGCDILIKEVHTLLDGIKTNPEKSAGLQEILGTCQKTDSAGQVEKVI